MSMVSPIFESNVSAFYIEEAVSFEFGLRRGLDVVWAKDYDVEVCVYTSQLSPRLWVCDYSNGFIPDGSRRGSDAGAVIVKGRDVFFVTLLPEFLSKLERGSVLTFGIRFVGSSLNVSQVVRTRKLQSMVILY